MSSNYIVLAGVPRYDESLSASETFLPGHLVEINTGQYRKHAAAATNAAPAFADINAELGDDKDVLWAVDSIAKIAYFGVGDRVHARFATGVSVVEGESFLESAGDGRLRKIVASAATDETERRSTVAVAGVTVTTTADDELVPVVIV